uniref:Two-component response regulator ARR1 n=1 Tax=Anthurium amnicola TaxID=1678845 RepID=A0A1D1XFE1_9ARAE
MGIMAAASTAGEERASRYREYVEALEEERRKIQVFQRELPLSLHLVSQTIESCRQHMAPGSGHSEIDEGETSSESGVPVLEEFIPIKRSSSSEACEDDDSHSSSKQKQLEEPKKRHDWLRSVQLWNEHPDPHPLPTEEEEEDDETPRRPIAVQARKPTGAFQPFQPRKPSPQAQVVALPAEVVAPVSGLAPPAPAGSSTTDSRGGGVGGAGGGEDKEGHPHRKARRCWSTELHRRFLDALQQLGGSDVATPKQIRELMKVDGLTNDEVKSHLQKYRLHSRRPSPTSQSNAGNPPPQQVVFLGGIWVPPPEYAAAAAAAAAATAHPPAEGMADPTIHAPIASVLMATPLQQQAKRSPGGPFLATVRGCGDEQRPADDGATRSHDSPATSSSSHTTTISPPHQC